MGKTPLHIKSARENGKKKIKKRQKKISLLKLHHVLLVKALQLQKHLVKAPRLQKKSIVIKKLKRKNF